MPKLPHEALHRIFRESPTLFAETIQRFFNADFPEIVEAQEIDTALFEDRPVERFVDTILRAETSAGPMMLVVEAQNKEDESKIRSWAYYLSYLENKYQIPAVLLVVTPSAATARWARGPLRLGTPGIPSMQLFPFVAGPDNIPFVTEVEEAIEDIDFAVYSILTHRLDDGIERALKSLAVALDTIDPHHGARLADLTEVGLGDGCAREIWRNIMRTMTYEWGSELARKSAADHVAGLVLRILNDRGIHLDSDLRARIERCQDLEMLDAWVVRASTVDQAEDLF
jgi:hypothetical protein